MVGVVVWLVVLDDVRVIVGLVVRVDVGEVVAVVIMQSRNSPEK